MAGSQVQAGVKLIVVPGVVVLLLLPAPEEEPLVRPHVLDWCQADIGWMTDGTNTQLKSYSPKIQGLVHGNFAIKSFTAPC